MSGIEEEGEDKEVKNTGLKRKVLITYELIMLILICISLITVFVSQEHSSIFNYINKIVWVIFLVDVTLRVLKSVSRWQYLKKNPFDIISIIPLEDFFLLARFARVIKLFRYKNLLKRYLIKLDGIARKYSVLKVTIIVIQLLITISLILTLTTLHPFRESLEWVLINFIKFNYDSPITHRNTYTALLSVVLKVFGVGYMGMVLNAIRLKVFNKYNKTKDTKKVKKEYDKTKV